MGMETALAFTGSKIKIHETVLSVADTTFTAGKIVSGDVVNGNVIIDGAARGLNETVEILSIEIIEKGSTLIAPKMKFVFFNQAYSLQGQGEIFDSSEMDTEPFLVPLSPTWQAIDAMKQKTMVNQSIFIVPSGVSKAVSYFAIATDTIVFTSQVIKIRVIYRQH